MRKTCRINSRYAKATESFKSAEEAIGPVVKNMALFTLTRGQWSMIDAILYVLDAVGRSKLSLWTWTVAEYEIQTLARLRMDKRLSFGLLVIDAGARVKNAAILREWQATFGPESVRYVLNHAKIATVESESGLKLLLRGSMNLNFNPRFEQFDITEGGPAFDMIRRVEGEIPLLPDNCSGEAVYAASRVGKSFDNETLSMFQGIKTWAK